MRKVYKDEKLVYRLLYKKGQKYRNKFVQALNCKEAYKIARKWIDTISKIYDKVFKALKCTGPADPTFAGLDEFVRCSTTGVLDTIMEYSDITPEEDAKCLAVFKVDVLREDIENMFWDIFDIYNFLKVCRLNGLNYWTGEDAENECNN